MLNLYRHNIAIPKYMQIVHDNRKFFVENTIDVLDEKMNGYTKHTDGALYNDSESFIDKFGNKVSLFDMSTGGMTVLNVLYFPQICFDTIECGRNALADLKNIHAGNIMAMTIYDYDGDDKCQICFNGINGQNVYSVKELF